eukprot:SAG25_NODE_7360_length_485_cov_1.212435_1_plen_83_part_10
MTRAAKIVVADNTNPAGPNSTSFRGLVLLLAFAACPRRILLGCRLHPYHRVPCCRAFWDVNEATIIILLGLFLSLSNTLQQRC